MLSQDELNESTKHSALFCQLGALDAQERNRQIQLHNELRRAIVESREHANGYAFRISPDLSLMEVAEWISNESKCCPFFDFLLNVQPGGAVWLKLAGREGIKPFMKVELNLHP
jgi:hypothetical protein